jgi:sugar/nucleoside kinase (ribokinase family)
MQHLLMFDVLVAGEINPDLILTGDVKPEFGQVEKLIESAALTIGSSAGIFACAAARLGLQVAFVGVCGNDVFGRFMLHAMQQRGVDTSNVIVRSDQSTGLSVILDRSSDRAILTFPGLIPALQASDIPDALLRQARHLHVASYFLQTDLQPGLQRLFQLAHSLRLTTSLDPNYDPSGKWTGLDELLSVTDVFLPNQTEALSVTRSSDVELASRQLARKAGLVVVKLGAAGALACEHDAITQVSSFPVNVLDAVGAGDTFDAGFLYGWLNRWDLQKSLRFACICGALSMRSAGGTDGQPTLDEALKHVSG